MKEIKDGDYLEFVQQNGQVIEIFVRPNGVLVKARDVGTELTIVRSSDYAITAESNTRKI